jgi:hypothetical protein
MPSNLLAIPLIRLIVETGTNEDWIDAVKFLVETGTETETMPQLDLRGIYFEMEVRRTAPDHQVVCNASTDDGSLKVGDTPNYGYLIIHVDIEEMKIQQAGKYVADIIGRDDEAQRVIAAIDLTIVEGITR